MDEAKQKKGMLLYLIEKNQGTPQEPLGPEDQTLMSRATFFRVMKDVEEDGLVFRPKPGDPHVLFMQPLAAKFASDVMLAAEIVRLKQQVDAIHFKFFESYYRWRTFLAEVCARCNEARTCIETQRQECPVFDKYETHESRKVLDEIAGMLADGQPREVRNSVSHETVSRETGISYIRRGSGEENMRVSHETGNSSLQTDPDPEEKKTPPTPPAESGERPEDAREVMRHILATSPRAEDEKQKVAVAKKEVWTIWTEMIRQKYGQDVPVGKLIGKDSNLVVQLIANYGLELTKKIVVLYLTHWERLKAGNPWITDITPTVGMLWHFRQSLVLVESGKAGWDVVRRTADEYDDDGREDRGRGRWPDRKDPKAAAPA